MGCVYNVRMDVYCSLSIYLSNYAPFSRNSLPPPQISVLRSVVSDGLVRLVGQKMVVGILDSFCVVFAPLLAPIPNFIQIRQKTQKLEIFTFGRFWLVGLVGRKMVAATSKNPLLPGRLWMTSVPSLNSIGWKMAELAHFWIFGWLAGWAGLHKRN